MYDVVVDVHRIRFEALMQRASRGRARDRIAA